jgi:uncharacterized repeat protein (TIGR03803 family)
MTEMRIADPCNYAPRCPRKKSPALLKTACLVLAFCLAAAIASSAQTFTTVAVLGGALGANPQYGALVQGSNGNLYGTTSDGGPCECGTIFELTPAGDLITIHDFEQTDGDLPQSGLVQASDGNFYGTTIYGGTNDEGTVFKMTPTGTLTTLHNFTFYPDGAYPIGGLIQASDGNLYGTTSTGGEMGGGTVFKMTPAGVLTTLYSFFESGAAYGTLVEAADGNLYGTTSSGGIFYFGSIFRISKSGTLTTLHSFSFRDGQSPYGSLVQGSDGYLYGTTSYGGHDVLYGTIFKISTTGTLTTVHTFDGLDGGAPYAGLIQASDGNLYGTALFGADGVGTVFEIATDGTLTTLHSFDYTDGVWPYGGLMQAADGKLYGTTNQGGAGYGTVYSIALASKVKNRAEPSDPSPVRETSDRQSTTTFTTLAKFNQSNGSNPYFVSLVQGTNGNLYGTTGTGGNGFGTVFEISPAGTIAVLHKFDYSDGAVPLGGLVQASNGNFYGTALEGGSANSGTIFEITPAGKFSTFYNFCTDSFGSCPYGASPYGTLARASDGSLYGTTSFGGTYNGGTVFKITPDSFTTVTDLGLSGSTPYAGVVQASDGNFYGTTYYGGANGYGTVYKMTPQGVVTALHSFDHSDGANPNDALVQASDGNLYGTTFTGGANLSYGTIFRISMAGEFMTLHNFDGLDGGTPYAGLIQGADGNLYGTSLFGNGVGTVFSITTDGTLTTLHTFDYTDGVWPFGGLVQAADGTFYGTTWEGGNAYGTVFSLSVGAQSNEPGRHSEPRIQTATQSETGRQP